MQDAHALQVLVVVLLAVLVLRLIARRLRVGAPLVLLLGGVPLAFLPRTAKVALPPKSCCCCSCRRCSTGRR